MAGRGSFQAIAADIAERLLALPFADRWDFAATERAAVLVARMDKAWVAIHSALSDGTLGEPPRADAVLGDHLVCQTAADDFVYLKHPQEVAEIARAPGGLSREEFKEKLAAVEGDEDSELFGLAFVPSKFNYIWSYFEDMREFYQRAAAERLAVLFSWG